MKYSPGAATTSPDANATGLLAAAPDPLRYDGQSDDPDEVAGIIASYLSSGSRILDVGCGTGSVSKIVADLTKARIVGVEPDAERAALARERGLEVINESFSDDVIAKIGKFDVVVFADVLEHTPNPASLLQLARKALIPGGAVIVSVPNVAHWTVRLDLLRGRFDYREHGIMDATHLRFFTESSLRRLLEAEGFGVMQMRQSAGFTLEAYGMRWPWRSMPNWRRTAVVRRLTHRLPLLFGCQHVAMAVMQPN